MEQKTLNIILGWGKWGGVGGGGGESRYIKTDGCFFTGNISTFF